MSTQTRMTQKQTFDALSLMKEHGRMVDGFWVYDKDWDDAKIAEKIGLKNVAPVQARRREVFGEMRRNPTFAPVNERLSEIERRLDALEDAYLRDDNRKQSSANGDMLLKLKEHFE